VPRHWYPLGLTLTLIAGGCAQVGISPQAFVQPTVKLDHLALRNAGIVGGTLDVVLAVYNPNRIRIRGTRVEAALSVDQKKFGDIVIDEPVQLEDRDTTKISAPLNFQWMGVGSAVRSALEYGTVNYEITGRLLVDTPTGQPIAVPFRGQGSVPLIRSGSR
jgi:hypothetical protein